MTSRRLASILAATGSLAVLAAASGVQAAARLGQGDLSLGRNAEAQSCRAVDRFETARGVRAYDLYCGEWPRPSGRVGRYEARAQAQAEAAVTRLCEGTRTPVDAAGFSELTQIACPGEIGRASCRERV